MHLFSLIFPKISQFNSLGFFSSPPQIMLIICLLSFSHLYRQPSTLLQKEINPEPLKDLELLKTHSSFRHANMGEEVSKGKRGSQTDS